MLYLPDGGAVEGALQPGLVDGPAANLAEVLGVEEALAPGFERDVDQDGLAAAARDPEVAPVVRLLARVASASPS